MEIKDTRRMLRVFENLASNCPGRIACLLGEVGAFRCMVSVTGFSHRARQGNRCDAIASCGDTVAGG
jgi:hypothetical protein